MIADAAKAVAMAGIMGGEYSGVAEDTTDVLLECAYFTPTAISGKARSYGLHTDSSHRYERGVDPQLQGRAMERATRLLLDIAGGAAGPVTEVVSPEHIEQRPEILLRRHQVTRLLGIEIGDAVIEDILTRLEMRVEGVEQGWRVTAPSCRFDIAIEADLIEEIGRIFGYTEIPTHRSSAATMMRSEPETHYSLDRAKSLLVERDYQEVITYSFISREMHDLMDPRHGTVELANPISSDMSVMRTSLWPGLLQVVRYNQSRQQGRIRLFESGLRFVRQDEEIKQEKMLAAVVTGSVDPEQWGQPARAVDFFDLKGDVQALLALTGLPGAFSFAAAEHPSLHPGQSARVLRDGEPLGWIGLLHPEIERKLDLTGSTYLFEMRLNGLLEGRLPAFEPLSKYPSIRRDIAIVVDQKVEFGQVVAQVRAAAPDILQDILLFDVYTGKNIDSGLKSLAFGLILQGTSYTLTDQEVDGAVERILVALKQGLNAQLRD